MKSLKFFLFVSAFFVLGCSTPQGAVDLGTTEEEFYFFYSPKTAETYHAANIYLWCIIGGVIQEYTHLRTETEYTTSGAPQVDDIKFLGIGSVCRNENCD